MRENPQLPNSISFGLLSLFLFLGCIKGSLSWNCTLPVDPGVCNRNLIRYFYNVETEACEEFRYGGCRGNDNRYESLLGCREACSKRIHSFRSPHQHIEAKQSVPFEHDIRFYSRCIQPKVAGPCRTFERRYYYDKTSRHCLPFRYGGCRGNLNNFHSLHECSEHCEQHHTPSRDDIVCAQPRKVGPCRAYEYRFYYNEQKDSCDEFIYSGCKGNDNNFHTRAECRATCHPQHDHLNSHNHHSHLPKLCFLKKEIGPCRGREKRYFFNPSSSECQSFIYSGCHANANNFKTYKECCAACHLSTNTGDEHVDTGIPGITNQNNVSDPINPFGSFDVIPYDSWVCALPKEPGPCGINNPRFYYNAEWQICKPFVYGGCGGNANQFNSHDECSQTCKDFSLFGDPRDKRNFGLDKYIPSQPFNYNGEKDLLSYWRYIVDQFTNKIPTLFDSSLPLNKDVDWGKYLLPSRNEPLIPDAGIFPHFLACLFPKERGHCHGSRIRSYFNSQSGRCESFEYSGCGGSPNNFKDPSQCADVCSHFLKEKGDNNPGDKVIQEPFVVPSPPSNLIPFNSWKCALPKDVGPCLAQIRRYFYNKERKRCEPLTYGGCGGNANAFHSQGECLQDCGGFSILGNAPRDDSQFNPGLNIYYPSERFSYNGEKDLLSYWKYIITNYAPRLHHPKPNGPLDRDIDWGKFLQIDRNRPQDNGPPSPHYLACLFPQEPGHCHNRQLRSFYDSNTGLCLAFEYNGCGGSPNNFMTPSECEDTCGRFLKKRLTPKNADSSKDKKILPKLPNFDLIPFNTWKCALPKDPGPCRALIRRYFYNEDWKNCEPFNFGGCGGNTNSFESQRECLNDCHDFSILGDKPLPHDWPDRGLNTYYPTHDFNYNNERDLLSYWKYTIQTYQPRMQLYDYRGPINRNIDWGKYLTIFRNEPPIEDSPFPHYLSCLLPKESSHCRQISLRSFFNREIGACDVFEYNGCGGSPNNFLSTSECESVCGRFVSNKDIDKPSLGDKDKEPPTTETSPPQELVPFNAWRCALPKESGPCTLNQHRFYYNAEWRKCKLFIYSGCGGNENRFENHEDCFESCRGFSVLGDDTNDIGVNLGLNKYFPWPDFKLDGEKNLLSYWRNLIAKKLDKPNPLSYPGKVDKDIDWGKYLPALQRDTDPKDSESFPLFLACLFPKESGQHCRRKQIRSFFNLKTGACETFEYGGCGGSPNNFQWPLKCEQVCDRFLANKKPDEPLDGRNYLSGEQLRCLDPLKKGNCQDTIPRFYYDIFSNQCLSFLYTGCLGNSNNFGSKRQCEAICVAPPPELLLDTESGPGSGPGTNPGSGPGRRPGSGPETNPGSGPGRRPGSGPETNPGSGPGTNPGSGPETNPGSGPGRRPGSGPETNPGLGPGRRPGSGPDTNPGSGPGRRPGSGPDTNPGSGPGRRPELGPLTNPGPKPFLPEPFLEEFLPIHDLFPEPVEYICSLPKSSEFCFRDTEIRYYFDSSVRKCKKFSFFGCGQNSNNFKSFSECKSTCIDTNPSKSAIDLYKEWDKYNKGPFGPRIRHPQNVDWAILLHPSRLVSTGQRSPSPHFFKVPEGFNHHLTCHHPKQYGNCPDRIQRYFFNPTSKKCEIFQYTGCGGSTNNFLSRDVCQSICEEFTGQEEPGNTDNGGTAQEPNDLNTGIDFCNLPRASGHCFANLQRYYFDVNSGECRSFTYSGCGGNANNFIVPRECEISCSSANRNSPRNPTNLGKNICFLSKQPGPCRRQISRYFYHSKLEKCIKFTYSGCGGNPNNFESLDDCRNACIQKNNDQIENTSGPFNAICQLPKFNGHCIEKEWRYYYERTRGKCLGFIFTGCGGNSNNFRTFDDCQTACTSPASTSGPQTPGGGSGGGDSPDESETGGVPDGSENGESPDEYDNGESPDGSGSDGSPKRPNKKPDGDFPNGSGNEPSNDDSPDNSDNGASPNGSGNNGSPDGSGNNGSPNGSGNEPSNEDSPDNSDNGDSPDGSGSDGSPPGSDDDKKSDGSKNGDSPNGSGNEPSNGDSPDDSNNGNSPDGSGSDGSDPGSDDDKKSDGSKNGKSPSGSGNEPSNGDSPDDSDNGNSPDGSDDQDKSPKQFGDEDTPNDGSPNESGNEESPDKSEPSEGFSDITNVPTYGENGIYFLDVFKKINPKDWEKEWPTLDWAYLLNPFRVELQLEEPLQDGGNKIITPTFEHYRACLLPKESGSCSRKSQRYFFDVNQSKCIPFQYNGCGGTPNNFLNEDLCEHICARYLEERKPGEPSDGPDENEPVQSGKDKSPNGSGNEDSPDGSGNEDSPDGSGINGSPNGSGDQGSPDGSGINESPNGSGDQGSPDGSGINGSPNGSEDQGSPDGSGNNGSPNGSGGQGSPDGSGINGSPNGSGGKGFPDGSEGNGSPNGSDNDGSPDTSRNGKSPNGSGGKGFPDGSDNGISPDESGSNSSPDESGLPNKSSPQGFSVIEKVPSYGNNGVYFLDEYKKINPDDWEQNWPKLDWGHLLNPSRRESQGEESPQREKNPIPSTFEHHRACLLPREPGSCSKTSKRYFYDAELSKCVPFKYNGCGGTPNNFLSLDSCEDICARYLGHLRSRQPSDDLPLYQAWKIYNNGPFGSHDKQPHDVDWGNLLRPIRELSKDHHTSGSKFFRVPNNFKEYHACLFPIETGHCSKRIERFAFDRETNQCVKIEYKGCGGNPNNFLDEDMCNHICSPYLGDEPENDPAEFVCGQPKAPGQCHLISNRFYYNTEKEKCVGFAYTGCVGNSNNFKTLEECKDFCRKPEPKINPICLLPQARGNCDESLWRFTYDSKTGKCEEFEYTGCGANSNNFKTRSACAISCHGYAGHKDQLNGAWRNFFEENPETANENNNRLDWGKLLHDSRLVFQGQNPTRPDYFKLPSDVEHHITCLAPRSKGECAITSTRYFFNTKSLKCEEFQYNGCEGTPNNFLLLSACNFICSRYFKFTLKDKPPIIPSGPSDRRRNAVCYLPKDKGNCVESIPQFYFDIESEKCLEFVYSGCDGNHNHFSSKVECISFCGDFIDESESLIVPEKGSGLGSGQSEHGFNPGGGSGGGFGFGNGDEYDTELPKIHGGFGPPSAGSPFVFGENSFSGLEHIYMGGNIEDSEFLQKLHAQCAVKQVHTHRVEDHAETQTRHEVHGAFSVHNLQEGDVEEEMKKRDSEVKDSDDEQEETSKVRTIELPDESNQLVEEADRKSIFEEINEGIQTTTVPDSESKDQDSVTTLSPEDDPGSVLSKTEEFISKIKLERSEE